MRKSYINRLNKYSEKYTELELEAADLEWEADYAQKRGRVGKAVSLRSKAKKLYERAWAWNEKAMALVEKMTEDEFYASEYPSQQCVTYEECTAHNDV